MNIENFIEELTKVNPTNLSKEGLKLFNTINEIIDKNKELEYKNKQLKEYIVVAPNLDEMTAIKYKSIQENAYIRGIAEEQQRAKEIIHNDYISKSKIKEKIEEINSRIEKYREYAEQGIETDIEWVDNVADRETVQVLQELLEE